MGQITAITEQIKNKKRVNIFIDGEYRCSLDKMAAFTYGLKDGLFIDDDRLDEVIRDSEQKSAFDAGVKYICIRMRTVSELKKYLSGKGYTHDTVAATIQKLSDYRYLNDQEFAKAYIKTYQNKHGNNKLAYDLVRLGVAQDIIDPLLCDNEEDEQAACEIVAKKYLKTHKNATYQKLSTYLYSKGFGSELAKTTAKNSIQTFED